MIGEDRAYRDPHSSGEDFGGIFRLTGKDRGAGGQREQFPFPGGDGRSQETDPKR
jgi:hypothetical protein